MGTVVAVVAVLLALVAAGSIAYIAWELTAEADSTDTDKDGTPPESR